MSTDSLPKIEGAVFIGVDVQVVRPCAMVVLDERNRMVESAWLEGKEPTDVSRNLLRAVSRLKAEFGLEADAIQVGIDAPRRALEVPRLHYWDGRNGCWRPKRKTDRGWGRHGEVVVSACGLARPQWTPLAADAPPWMEVGFSLFRELESRGIGVHEVFPSASYFMLKGDRNAPVAIDFSAFSEGPKDMLDACMAAFTVQQFCEGRGVAVGSDGLGPIVLPRQLPAHTRKRLLVWPGAGVRGDNRSY